MVTSLSILFLTVFGFFSVYAAFDSLVTRIKKRKRMTPQTEPIHQQPVLEFGQQ
ncbi:hypothetical protein GCM10007216_28600 [Thalassobacillus devorans]|uniref:Uncharacterized protein n=1 Tax=Thalassobacillus devorans TaxID=279813 RepID=A0ABQ1PFI0_9BACI|nr:hypothetical protein [Thalassobacillus devorans]NIK29366.1 hypothetical protein [Thalassobacillus devorans]GGC96126.1 hypothetical protein GCM10007216_28600 [Thalassobacillus devorans]